MRRKIGNVNWLQLQTENDFKVFNSMMEEERMVDIILTVIATISMIVGLLGIFAVIHNYAIDTIGEMKYMLREAEKRQEIFYTKAEAEYIESLKNRIENHWGRRLIRKKDRSIFDIM